MFPARPGRGTFHTRELRTVYPHFACEEAGQEPALPLAPLRAHAYTPFFARLFSASWRLLAPFASRSGTMPNACLIHTVVELKRQAALARAETNEGEPRQRG